MFGILVGTIPVAILGRSRRRQYLGAAGAPHSQILKTKKAPDALPRHPGLLQAGCLLALYMALALYMGLGLHMRSLTPAR